MKYSNEHVFYIAAIVLLLAGALLCAAFWPDIEAFLTARQIDSATQALAVHAEALSARAGVFGWAVLLALNTLQVVLAFMPGKPVEIACGALYGWGFGTVLCLAGDLIGEWLIFALVRRCGVTLANKLLKQDVRELRVFKNQERLEAFVFVLFLLPGIQKDVLTYALAFSPVPTARFLFITLLARLPSILSSTIISSAVLAGDFRLGAVVLFVTWLAGFVAMLCKEKLLALFSKNRPR